MKKIFFSISLIWLVSMVSAQNRFFSRTGTIRFFSETPIENIQAENRQVNCVIDTDKSEVAFSLLMKSFVFPNALMQEHFNENYVESDKYPKAIFKGKFPEKIDLSRNGSQTLHLTGELTLHNVTKTIQIPANVEVKEGKLVANTRFEILPQDYRIEIPALVRDKIAKQITVNVSATCQPVK
ncbi:MAG: YceI family protein [Verrucomicrobia bacterium]|nr:YceI family protein [Cytophagales bacterium]